MSSWLDGPECAFLVSICVEEKYCFSPLLYINLKSERLGGLHSAFFGHFSPFQSLKRCTDPLTPSYLLRVVCLILHTVDTLEHFFCLMYCTPTAPRDELKSTFSNSCHVPVCCYILTRY